MCLCYHATQTNSLHFKQLFEERGHTMQRWPGLPRSSRKIMPCYHHGPFQPSSSSPCVHLFTFCQAPAPLLQALPYSKIMQKSLVYTLWMSSYLPDPQSGVLSTSPGPVMSSFRWTLCRKFRGCLYFVLSKLNCRGGKPWNSLPIVHQQIYATVTHLILVLFFFLFLHKRAFCGEVVPIIPPW